MWRDKETNQYVFVNINKEYDCVAWEKPIASFEEMKEKAIWVPVPTFGGASKE